MYYTFFSRGNVTHIPVVRDYTTYSAANLPITVQYRICKFCCIYNNSRKKQKHFNWYKQKILSYVNQKSFQSYDIDNIAVFKSNIFGIVLTAFLFRHTNVRFRSWSSNPLSVNAPLVHCHCLKQSQPNILHINCNYSSTDSLTLSKS